MKTNDDKSSVTEAVRRGALYSGQRLAAADWLESDNGLFRAGFELNGNFAIFVYSTTSLRREGLWVGMARHPVTGSSLYMHPSGRIILQSPSGDDIAFRGCIQQSNTYACRNNRDPFCVMQDDGNFVVYTHTPQGVKPIWATDTWRSNSQWQHLTIPGAVHVVLDGATMSPTITKTIQNTSGRPLVIVDGSQTMTVTPAGTIAIYTPSDTVGVSGVAYDFDTAGQGSANATAAKRYGPSEDVIQVGFGASGLTLT